VDRSKRKIEHINNALSTGQIHQHGLDDVRFVHQSLPNIRTESVDLKTNIGELSLSSPFFVNGMTGGGGVETYKVNQQLATAAAHFNIPMAVGSQMAALKDSSQSYSYRIVRETNPKGIVIANLGAEATIEQVKRAVDMLEANGIQIHLNAIQELVMPEGDRDFTSWIRNIEKIVACAEVPVIVKEVGFGISYETAEILNGIGVNTIDIGGYGGTNFSMVENMRREIRLEGFNSWGITTASSIAEVSHVTPEVYIIASGGIKNGFHAAKAISLGASSVAFAGTFLREIKENGIDGLIDYIDQLYIELKTIMTGLGVKTIHQLQRTPIVISGDTYHWLDQRGIDTTTYSQRGSQFL
jgi:isopentenyl-diphosphate delta-isomerase